MNRERWALRSDLRILRNLRECYLDRLFKLRIASGDYVSRRDLDIEIRRYADILDSPRRATWIVRGTIRKTNRTSVDERRDAANQQRAISGRLGQYGDGYQDYERECTEHGVPRVGELSCLVRLNIRAKDEIRIPFRFVT